jgi:DNA-binding NarL/FixJ family response regulator
VRPAHQAWKNAASAWDELDRPPLAAYCRWREAEARVAAGASRAEAAVPLRSAYEVALRLGARPLLREIELLAERARLVLEALDVATVPAAGGDALAELGLTRREAEVLALLARGLTNREIARELVISVKTADVHVSHILRKHDVPNRLEAAAAAHRLLPPPAK